MALTRTTRLSSNSTPAGFGTGGFTTASFTPSNNSLLVVAVAAMETSGTTDPSGDITISGGGWTWTARATIGKSASFSMGLRIFTAPVTTGASMTLTVDCGTRSIERYVISAVDYTGYDTGTPTGATATDAAGATDGAETITLSAAPAAGSEVFAALATDTGSGSTPGTGWTEIHDNQALGDAGIQTQARLATLVGPTFSSAGAGAITEASGGALSPASPATVDSGDLLVIFAYYEGTTTTPSTPSGFTLVDGPRTLASSVGRCWVFAKIADGTEDGAANALGTPAVTTMRAARCYRFVNVRSDTVANVVGGFAFDGPASSATVNDVGVTTPEDNCLAVNLLTVADDNAVGNFTGETGGDWTEAVAEYTSAATTPDYCQQLQTAAIATAGTINGGSLTMGAADPFGVVGFYIRGAGANFDPVVSWADISTGTPPGSTILAAVEVKEAASGITGTAAVTQEDDTSTASGQLGYSGSSTATQEDQTSTASGTVSGPVTGTVAVTQADQTSTASGQLGYSGTSAATQADQTSAASGQLGYSGSSATTQADQTSAAAGQLGSAGTTAVTQDDQTSTASGTVAGVGEISGSATVTQDDQTSTATGQLGSTGTTAASQADQTATAAGTVINPVTGTLAATQADQTSAAAGQLGYTGTIAVTQADQTAAASGTFAIAIDGLVAALQSDQVAAATGFVGVIPVPAGVPVVAARRIYSVTVTGPHNQVTVAAHGVTTGSDSHAVEVS